MKKIRDKLVVILEWIIGIALTGCLFLSGFGLLGYAAAFIIGGDTAGAICEFLSKTYYAFLIKGSTITVLLCFALQYFNGNAKWVNPIQRQKNSKVSESENIDEKG